MTKTGASGDMLEISKRAATRIVASTLMTRVSGLDHTLPTNTVYSPLDLGHPGVGNRREDENGSVECRRI